LADSVICFQDSSHVFTCQAQIDADPSPTHPPSDSSKVEPQAPTAEDPAVRTLVERYTRTVPAQSAPYWSSAAVSQCASGSFGVVLAVSSGKGPLVAALTALKAGIDIAKCISDQHEKASEAATARKIVDVCAAEGGVITAVVGNKSTCEVRGTTR